ncbi:hypothetical protein [Roseimaritima ulvae]|uniref:Uncharacterized protein n=1 Tax=Roseimaritima ulvae TaxID=980254 RepID=A0A5B9QJJ6_9BACT|nr:hypothetical protein [Roseimaritima ulvae]QEG38139.1 hypothetical protein UC8_00920 [Roseimaritima ulvae]
MTIASTGLPQKEDGERGPAVSGMEFARPLLTSTASGCFAPEVALLVPASPRILQVNWESVPNKRPYQHLDIHQVLSFSNGAIAIASLSAVGEWQLLALDSNASFVGRSKSLDLWYPTTNVGIAAKTPARGMAVVVDYIADEVDEYAHTEIAAWFSYQRKSNTITTKLLGTWDEHDLRFNINGWPWRDGYLWAGCLAGKTPGGFEGSQLILGYGKQGRVPTPYPTGVSCRSFSTPFSHEGNTLMVLQTASSNQLEIWAINDPANPRKVMDLANAAKHRQLFGPKLLRSGDSIVAFWCEYTGGGKGITHLKAARVELDSGRVSKPKLLTEDEDIVGLTLIHATIDDSEFFAWESRKRGTRIHALRVKDILDGPYDPVKLNAGTEQRLFCLKMKQPLLIQSLHSEERKNWTAGCEIPG